MSCALQAYLKTAKKSLTAFGAAMSKGKTLVANIEKDAGWAWAQGTPLVASLQQAISECEKMNHGFFATAMFAPLQTMKKSYDDATFLNQLRLIPDVDEQVKKIEKEVKRLMSQFTAYHSA